MVLAPGWRATKYTSPPSQRPGACEVRSPRPPNGHLWAPRVDQVAYLSGMERQGCSWGACRESEGRAAAQPPGACARTQKVAWRRCCRVQIAAPRCPRRSPARLGHRTRRPNKQQRKTGSYTALPVASSWPPHRRRQLRSHLSRHRARPCCRHITPNMILNQPRAWSAEPSGLLSAPWAPHELAAHHATGARESEEVMEVREVWRQAHLKQPLGSRDGSRTRQRGGSGLKSTTGGSRGGSSSIDRAGGVLHRRGNRGPTARCW